jgi:hypothetical protein
MAGIDDVYTREVHKELNLYGAWPPDTNFRLGDYGEFAGCIFKRIGNITDDFGISLQEEVTDDDEITFTSKGVVNVDLKVEVDSQGRATGSAKLNVQFNRDNAVFFLATGIKTRRVANMKAMGDALIAVYRRPGKDWRLNMAVITELKTARELVALISRKNRAALGLRGKVKVGKNKPTTVDLQALEVEVNNSDVVNFLDENGSTPLFRLHQVRDPATGKPFLDTQP